MRGGSFNPVAAHRLPPPYPLGCGHHLLVTTGMEAIFAQHPQIHAVLAVQLFGDN